jgi:hypothetical protein
LCFINICFRPLMIFTNRSRHSIKNEVSTNSKHWNVFGEAIRLLTSPTLNIIVAYFTTYRVIKRLCASDDYNTESYKYCSKCPPSVSRQEDNRLKITPFVIPNSNYVIIVSDLNSLKYFCVFLCYDHQVHRNVLFTLYINN